MACCYGNGICERVRDEKSFPGSEAKAALHRYANSAKRRGRRGWGWVDLEALKMRGGGGSKRSELNVGELTSTLRQRGRQVRNKETSTQVSISLRLGGRKKTA